MLPDTAVYLAQTDWLLGQFAAILGGLPPDAVLFEPVTSAEANSPLVIAKHALAVTEAYALGIGCGMQVARDRPGEFVATNGRQETIYAIEAVRQLLPAAFDGVQRGRLDVAVLPPQSLYGTGEPRRMTPREAIVENIRHLGIHLGELRLTKDLAAKS